MNLYISNKSWSFFKKVTEILENQAENESVSQVLNQFVISINTPKYNIWSNEDVEQQTEKQK